uniref:Fibronectin type-III domain-containing protein n=1 Tax=Anopheles minimus TaxID=112268 RepID=A0A182WIA8_9DIPT
MKNLLADYGGHGSIPTAPENITVTFLTPTSVRVSWQTSMDPHTMPVDKYDVTYKPTDARTKCSSGFFAK